MFFANMLARFGFVIILHVSRHLTLSSSDERTAYEYSGLAALHLATAQSSVVHFPSHLDALLAQSLPVTVSVGWQAGEYVSGAGAGGGPLLEGGGASASIAEPPSARNCIFLRKCNSFVAACVSGFFFSTPAVFFSTARNLAASVENEDEEVEEEVEGGGVSTGEGSAVGLAGAVG